MTRAGAVRRAGLPTRFQAPLSLSDAAFAASAVWSPFFPNGCFHKGSSDHSDRKHYMHFRDLNLNPAILAALEAKGYEKPTPIQAGAIPAVLEERDVWGCAQTGTGKTAAFALPILHNLASRPFVKTNAVRALVLSPTRELALQISEQFLAYGKGLRLRTAVI